MIDMNLTRRLEKHALAKFGGNRRQALVYLREKAMFYAQKTDRLRGQPNYGKWYSVYLAYSSAAYRQDYYLSMDEEPRDDYPSSFA